MTYWGQELSVRKNTRRMTMALIDQFLFVLVRLKVCQQFLTQIYTNYEGVIMSQYNCMTGAINWSLSET